MAASDPAYRNDVEGLRGLAILLVVGFHAGVPWLAGGFVGVDVFFVLSGFFITGLLVRELDAHGELRLMEFYGRRSLRLLPPLLVVLWTTLALVMWLYAPIDRAAVAETARSVALTSSNVAFARDAVNYFSATENPLLHTWSLAVEEQFYLVWPLLLFLAVLVSEGRRNVRPDAARRGVLFAIALAGIASFAAALVMTTRSQPAAFFGTAMRIWEFAVGGALLVLLRDARPLGRPAAIGLQSAGLALILLAVAAYDAGTPYPGAAATLPVLGAAALLAGGRHDAGSPIARVLAVRPLRDLGRLSYAWYLWHWPLVSLGGVLSPRIGVGGKLLWSLAALGLAWLTHRLVERPARSGRLSRLSTLQISSLALVLSIGTALVATAATQRAEWRASRLDQRAFAAAREDRMEHGCWAATSEAPTARCEFGDPRSTTTLMLLGDSHAEHWLGGLDRAGRERGWKVIAMVKGGCPVADVRDTGRGSTRARWRECADYRETMLRRIVAVRPAAVILSSWNHYVAKEGSRGAWQVSAGEWEQGLRRTYTRLAAAGIPVVVLRGTPRTHFDVPACLSRRAATLPFASECTYDRSESALQAAVDAQTSAARGLPIRFVDMNDRICAAPRCPVVRDGIVIFTDDNHLTASFTRSLAPVLGERLGSALAAVGARRSDAMRRDRSPGEPASR